MSNSYSQIINKKKIVFSWFGMPMYAAYQLRVAVRENPQIEIIAIKFNLPVLNVEEIINKKIIWIEDHITTWEKLGLEIPDIYFQAGWFKKSFSSLGDQVKKNGGKVVLLCDNSFKKNLRQLIGSFVYKFKFKNKFDAVWVCGKSGESLMKFYGVEKDQIYKTIYATNDKIFFAGDNLESRQKYFLFVGRLIKRKGVLELLNAFSKFAKTNKDWSLIIVGAGPLKEKIPSNNNIIYSEFTSPENISKLMRSSRFLILPSREDHWGLVVNEASLSGCGLILSDVVGAIPEFSSIENSFIFKTKSSNDLFKALEKATKLDSIQLSNMFNKSLELGSKYKIKNWKETFIKIIYDLCK